MPACKSCLTQVFWHIEILIEITHQEYLTMILSLKVILKN